MKVWTVGDVHFDLMWFWLNELDSGEELGLHGLLGRMTSGITPGGHPYYTRYRSTGFVSR